MKLILSRKGFDTSTGGRPSPIFPDGTMVSLPIPDKASIIAYRDIAGNRWASVGELVQQLADVPATHRAHLDPDLCYSSVPRAHGWQPLFGQEGAAERHLENQGVGTGDVFLFFGLFRRVKKSAGRWCYECESRPMHVIFGWLQIAERIAVSSWPADADWALYHPHFRHQNQPMNALYRATQWLSLPTLKSAVTAGVGVFPCFAPRLRLTEPDSRCPSHWFLPEWFHPNGRGSVLSYHSDVSRWRMSKAGLTLTSVSRGQEFVLDCGDYPEAINWLVERLFQQSCC